jgi:predicted transposase/invertase (TIGR01784 family)
MTKKKKLSQDGMIKELIRDYPEDALDFFEPEICKRYGKPVSIDFHIQENKKHHHRDKKLINDMAVIYRFANGKKVVLTLVEHWSRKSKFDIHRFAHYLIDLDFQFPGYEKLPVALFTDESKIWRNDIQREIRIKCLDKVYMGFTFRCIRMKEHEAENYRNTKNRFLAVLRSAMLWENSKKILLAIDLLTNYNDIEENKKIVIKNIDVIEYYLHINGTEKIIIADILEERRESNMIVEELEKRGEIKGKFKGKLETAQKMHQKGFSLEDIIEITELSEEELKKAGIF